MAKYHDFRELVTNPNLNAVVVGTVNHWHAMTSIAAMKAGLDVYCEKPLALTIAEGQAMVKAARKYDRIFQTGNMQRSDSTYRLACELVRNGRFGKIHTVEARIGENPKGGPFKESEVPKGLDWDFWKGPTPDVAYIKQKCHYEFRWWYEYSGGKLTDWGAHHNDIAQWGLGKDDTGPVSATAVGSDFGQGFDPTHNYNCHHHFAVTYEYADGTRLVTTSEGENGNRFLGENGWIFVNRSRIEASDPKLLDEAAWPWRHAASTTRATTGGRTTTTWPTSSKASGPASGRSATSRSATTRPTSATSAPSPCGSAVPSTGTPPPNSSSAPTPTRPTPWSPANTARPGSSRSEAVWRVVSSQSPVGRYDRSRLGSFPDRLLATECCLLPKSSSRSRRS